jgi:GxxExxY protein
VLSAVFEVSSTLGAGYLEKVYERALLRELKLRDIRATALASFTVTYKGHRIGEYFGDEIPVTPSVLADRDNSPGL